MSTYAAPSPPSVSDDRLGRNADDVYALLTSAHDGLSDAESHALNARLVLVLANALGDPQRIAAAITLARKALR